MNIVDRTIVVSLNAVTFFPFFSVFFSVFVGGFLGVVRLDNFKRIWRRHHCRLKAPNVDLRSALMIIEQWGFFSVPHLLLDSNILLLWSSLRTCFTHIYFRAFITPSIFYLGLLYVGFEHPTFCMRGERSKRQCHRYGFFLFTAISKYIEINSL